MTIEKRFFGKTRDEVDVDAYTLSDDGIQVEIITFGATIRNIIIPASDGPRDINLGFDEVSDYETKTGYLGTIVGRYANRIAKAEFTLNGVKYQMDDNDGENSLHGGYNAFDQKVWNAEVKQDGLYLKLFSPDMENGFPGNLNVEVKYSLKNRELMIEYTATSDADTPINLTNHAYFNLNGHKSGGIEKHKIQIFADFITPVDETYIPTGKLMDVTDTPFDLRTPTIIKQGLDSDHRQIILGDGYDHNFVLSELPYQNLTKVAVLESGGIRMTCLTTKPGIQLYTGNMLIGETGKDNAKYDVRTGLCLETQYWPDSVNKPEFPSSILKKGETYNHTTVYKFDF